MSNEPSITPLENGPYRLQGLDSITQWSDGTSVALTGTAMLCRCGGSANKPFCDGTHRNNGFTSDKDPNRVPDKLENYTSADGRLIIHDNRGLCAHAGRCTDNLASVFRLGSEPFVDPDGAKVEEIVDVIAMCPSGALSYTLDGTPNRNPDVQPSVAYPPGGPYVLTGVQIDGAEKPAGSTNDQCTLCRCGASLNKPFCNGAHWTVDFDENTPDTGTP